MIPAFENIHRDIEDKRAEAAEILAAEGPLAQEELDEMVIDTMADLSSEAIEQAHDDSVIEDGENLASVINNQGQEDQVAALLAFDVKPSLIVEKCKPETGSEPTP